MNTMRRVGWLAVLGALAFPGLVLAQPGPGQALGGESVEPPFRRRIIDRYDTDRNGQLSDEERAAIRRDIDEGRLEVPPAVREWLRGRAGGPTVSPAERLMRNVVVERDIEYGRAGDRPLKLDILRPREPGSEPLPLVVFIHGGGWRAGDKSGGIGRLMPYVASGKYVGATVGYRLSGEATWPAQIHDCKAAIRFLRANAEKYGIDPKRIGVWGPSAGGHLVSLLGTSGDVAELEGECGSPGQSSRVQCGVDFCGPSDFPAIGQLTGGDAPGAVGALLGGPIAEKQAEAKAASPVTHVTPDDPPFLIVHGTEDPIVPLKQAETLHAALTKAGVSSVFVKIEGGGHGFGGPEVEARVRAFLDKHLRGEAVEVSGEPIQQ